MRSGTDQQPNGAYNRFGWSVRKAFARRRRSAADEAEFDAVRRAAGFLALLVFKIVEGRPLDAAIDEAITQLRVPRNS